MSQINHEFAIDNSVGESLEPVDHADQSDISAFQSMLAFIENNKDGVKIDDRRCVLLGAVAILAAGSCLAFVVNSGEGSAGEGTPVGAVALIADVLLGAAILHYCLKRAKFISKIDRRYASLCWHLALGTGVLFSFFATNMMMLLMTMNHLSH